LKDAYPQRDIFKVYWKKNLGVELSYEPT
jgi:hypothetical protein